MNDKEFYQFKKSVEHERDIPYREMDWLELKKRLDAAANAKRPSRLLLWAAAIALLFLLGQWIVYGQLQAKLQQIEFALHQIDSTHQNNTRLLERVDTVIIEKYVYQPTASHSLAKTALTFFEPPLVSMNLTAPANGSLFRSVDPFLPVPLSLNKLVNGTAPVPKIIEQQSASSTEAPLEETASLFPPPSIRLLPATGLSAKLAPVIGPTTSRKPGAVSFLIKKIIPRKLAIEVVGAFGLPLSQESENASILWRGGGSINARFAHGWSLLGGVHYQSAIYQFDSFQPDLGVPPIDPPAEGFTFEHAKLSQHSLLYELGLRWQYSRPSSWTPFLQVRYQNAFHTTAQIGYSFEGDDVEVVVESEALDRRNDERWLGTGVGLWFQPPRSPWVIGLNGQYDYSLGDDPTASTQRLTLETRIQYSF